MFQILINREEKENFFFKILKMEKRKRMKIQFFRARGSERGQYFSRFLEIRDSCPCLFQLNGDAGAFDPSKFESFLGESCFYALTLLSPVPDWSRMSNSQTPRIDATLLQPNITTHNDFYRLTA